MAQYTTWRTNAETLLAEQHYGLEQGVLDSLAAGDYSVIPKLMARTYLDAVTASTNVIAQSMPQIIENLNRNRDVSKGAEDRFFGQWPGLKDHYQRVLEVGQVYRQLNPKASEEDFIKHVGATAATVLGVDPATLRGQAEAPKPRVVPGPTVAPHRPPVPGARSVAPAAPVNPFEALAMDTDEE